MRSLGRKSRESAVEQSLVWLIGSPRTGSTWLMNLLRVQPSLRVLDEPLIGAHLGLAAAAVVGMVAPASAAGDDWRALDRWARHEPYFFSERYRPVWEPPLRALVLARLGAQLVDQGGRPGKDLLVIKEPHGSEAADVFARLTPGSRLLVLVRDGRDVVDSLLDALSKGGWASGLAQVEDDPAQRLLFLQQAATTWVRRMDLATRALRSHDADRGLLLRYEDLLSAPQRELERTLTWMGVGIPAGLAEHVDLLGFDRVAAENKGAGHFHRAATPGGWRENLSSAERSVVAEIMDPMLSELGYSAS